VRLTIHHHLVSRLRMNGALNLLSHMPSRRTRQQLGLNGVPLLQVRCLTNVSSIYFSVFLWQNPYLGNPPLCLRGYYLDILRSCPYYKKKIYYNKSWSLSLVLQNKVHEFSYTFFVPSTENLIKCWLKKRLLLNHV